MDNSIKSSIRLFMEGHIPIASNLAARFSKKIIVLPGMRRSWRSGISPNMGRACPPIARRSKSARKPGCCNAGNLYRPTRICICINQRPGKSLKRGILDMKNRAYAIPFVTLCVSAFLYSGLVAAEDNAPSTSKSAAYRVANIAQAGASEFAPQSTQYPSNFRLAASKSSAQRACELRCKKDYRRCYGQGNRPGTPEVNGGQPCSEQQTTCLRACADNPNPQ